MTATKPGRFATSEDFARWTERAQVASPESLDYVIRDALAAAHALDRHDAIGASRYRDEAYTYAAERVRRLNTIPTVTV